MRLAPHLMLAPLAVTLAGCTAIDMDRMENRYESLVLTSAQPPPQIGSTADVAPALMRAGTDDSFLDLAVRSRDLAGSADDVATQIALLRISSLSGWQSNRPQGFDIAYASSDEARRKCAGIDPQRQFRPARDCAIAEIMPMILSAETLMDDVVAPNPPEPATVEQGRQRLELIRRARVDFVDRLPGWDRAIEPAIGGNVQLDQWYRGSRRLYACVTYIRLSPPLTTVDEALNAQLVEAADDLALAIGTGLEVSGSNALNVECSNVVAWRGNYLRSENRAAG